MPKSSTRAVAVTGLFALLCGVSAALQYNDPDPLRWIAMYLGGGIAALIAVLRPARWWAALAVGLVAAAWGAAVLAGIAGVVELSDLWRKMSEKGGHAEELREALGLLIVAAGCGGAALYARRISAASP